MATEEIAGAVIDSGLVTNDPCQIDAALFSRHRVQYISRDRARSLAVWTSRREWEALADGPALGIVIGGVFYKRNDPWSELPISFPMSGTPVAALPAVAG